MFLQHHVVGADDREQWATGECGDNVERDRRVYT